jgi:flavodoxin
MSMKTLVVYYSRKGHTAELAGQIAKELGADTEVITDRKKRNGPLGWMSAGRESMGDIPAEIEEPKRDPAGYELVVVGTPVWAGKISTPARAYCRKFAGKFPQLAFFTTSAGENEGTFEHMASLAGKAPKATLSVRNKEQKAGAHADRVREFVGKLKA